MFRYLIYNTHVKDIKLCGVIWNVVESGLQKKRRLKNRRSQISSKIITFRNPIF